MKHFYQFFLFLMIISSVACSNKVSYEELNFKSDIAQFKGEPYTGNFFETYPNGSTKQEGEFKDGVPVGKLIRYHENKQIQSEEIFVVKVSKKGKTRSYLDGVSKEYYENGKPKSIQTYKMGDKDGLHEFFNDNGFKYSSINYRFDKKHGSFVEYYDDGKEGKLKNKGSYNMGEADGEFLQYNENGKLYRKALYKNGTMISEEHYD